MNIALRIEKLTEMGYTCEVDIRKSLNYDSDISERLKRVGTMQTFSLVSGGAKMAYPEVWCIFKSDEKSTGWPSALKGTTSWTQIRALTRPARRSGIPPVRSFGYGGAWVVVEDDGVIRSSDLSKKSSAEHDRSRRLLRGVYGQDTAVNCSQYTSVFNPYILIGPSSIATFFLRLTAFRKHCTMLFAFGRTEGAYYISNGKKNYWKGLSNSLSKHLKRDPLLITISFGVNDTWFYREAPRGGADGSCFLSGSVGIHYPRVTEIQRSNETINWVAFGPSGEYVVDTDNKLYHSETGIVRKYKKGGAQVPLRCASFGYDGAWVCVEDDGEIRSLGLSAKIKAALNKKAVRNVQLSAHSPSVYFIEYVDGETMWSMPSSWHSNIKNIEAISVRLDNPGTPGEQSVSQRVIFAFGHKNEYCISKGGQAHWKGLNYDSDISER
ncbi:hypothetical protein B0H19DRAFT_1230385, partial [Mycena capillaripes]